MKNTLQEGLNEAYEIMNELAATAEKYPMCNTIVFNTYKEDKKLTEAIKGLLSNRMNKDYKVLVEEPTEEHPEGSCHLAIISDKPMKLKDLFNNLYK